MICALGNNTNPYQQQKQAFVKERYNEIYTHEQAHKRAAGSFGGAIVIERDANGIPTGGHVDIQMPVLNENNPDETINHADVVINSAMAPDDPSKQDYKVASEAKTTKAQAQKCKDEQQTGQKLNLIA